MRLKRGSTDTRHVELLLAVEPAARSEALSEATASSLLFSTLLLCMTLASRVRWRRRSSAAPHETPHDA
jgi:hypothetical protein